jgi:hypothetical protein
MHKYNEKGLYFFDGSFLLILLFSQENLFIKKYKKIDGYIL